MTVLEDIKANARDFLGKDDYQVGDISREVDTRVKDEVAKLRNKDEYELGDFVLAMDEMSKKYTEELTGKPYEPGDLSTHLDQNIKASVAEFCGKEEYEVGDLTREIGKRIESRVGEFTGKEGYEVRVISLRISDDLSPCRIQHCTYSTCFHLMCPLLFFFFCHNTISFRPIFLKQFGDISREVENRRKRWVKEYLGEEAAADYKFGDITRKALGQFTGKGDDYQFGDATKKVLGSLFGNKKK